MTIWADADSLQPELRRVLEKRSRNEAAMGGIPRFRLVHVASRRIPVPGDIHFILVESGPDAADRYIEAEARAGDLAVTRDLPLAERLAMKGIVVLNDRGECFSPDKARERRSLRDEAERLRALGLAPESPRRRSWGQGELKAFADAFDRELQKRLRAETRSPLPPDEGKSGDESGDHGEVGEGGLGANEGRAAEAPSIAGGAGTEDESPGRGAGPCTGSTGGGAGRAPGALEAGAPPAASVASGGPSKVADAPSSSDESAAGGSSPAWGVVEGSGSREGR